MEQRQLLGPRPAREPHRVVDRAVAPVELHGELVLGVLRIVNEQIDAVGKLERTVARREAAVVGLLMITDVGDAAAVPLDAVAERRADVRNEARQHPYITDGELVVGEVVEPERAREVVDADGEQRRPDRGLEHLAHRSAVVLDRGVDIELGTGLQHRSEERQSLSVIPVEVGQQARTPERSIVGLAGAEVPQAGAEIEQDRRLPREVDRHRRRVAAVPLDVIAATRGGTPHAMERDPNA